MPFYALEKTENLHNGYRRHFDIADQALLLIQTEDIVHLVENKCGHFGMPLEAGELKEGTIVCPQHGISFSLETGELANRPWENADPIKIFEITYRDGYLGVVLDSPDQS